jgi:hypothetical protein
MVEVAPSRIYSDVVGRQQDVRARAAVVLLDVWLEVVGVGDRSETWCQRKESSDRHIVTVVSDLGSTIVLCGGHDLGPRLAVRVRDQTLRAAVVRLVLGASSVLDIVAIAFFTLHDAMDGAHEVYSRS